MSINQSPVGTPIAEQGGVCSLAWVQWFRSVWTAINAWRSSQRTTLTTSIPNISAHGWTSASFNNPEFKGITEQDIAIFTVETTGSNSSCVYEVKLGTNSVSLVVKNYTDTLATAHNPVFNIIIFRK